MTRGPTAIDAELSAARVGLDLVRLLVTHGARVDARTAQDGYQPIHLACLLGHLDTVDVHHSEFGAALDEPLLTRLRPIHLACLCGHVLLAGWLRAQHAGLRPTELTAAQTAELLRSLLQHGLLEVATEQELQAMRAGATSIIEGVEA